MQSGAAHGKPFTTRKDAEHYATRIKLDDYEIEKFQRGFVVTPANRAMLPEELPQLQRVQTLARVEIDDAVAEIHAAPPRAPVVELPPETPQAPAAHADPELDGEFEHAITDAPDLAGSYQAPDGRIIQGSAKQLLADLDEEETTLRSIFNCVIGGGAE